MKIYHFPLLVFLSTYLLFSCNKEQQEPLTNNKVEAYTNSENPRVVIYKGYKTLSFPSEKSLNEWFLSLASLSGKQQSQKVIKLGIKSYYSIYEELVAELDSKLSSEWKSELKNINYSNWKNKIAEFGCFSPNPEDIYPIFRGISLAESNTANERGIYLVCGKERQVTKYKNYETYLADEGKSYRSYTFASGSLRANNAFTKTRNRKARLEIRVDKVNYALQLRFSAQKKNGFIATWWDRCSTTFGARIRITELSHPFEVYEATGFYWKISRLLSGATKEELAPFILEPNNEGEHRINLGTHELKEEILPFGRFLLESDTNDDIFNKSCKMKGYMEVWTRGIPQHSSGKDAIDIEITL